MKNQIISLIAAVGKNRELGFKNDLIWKIPNDMEFFKKKTTGHSVIMGQKTYESIGRPLPKRKNIILTRDEKYKVDGCFIANSIDESLDLAGEGEIFVIGGGQIYTQMIEVADKLYLTVIDKDAPADTYFPAYTDFKKTKVLSSGEYKGTKYQILELERK